VLVLRADGNPTIVTVGSGGYSTISAAVSAATPGDIVRVEPGVYREQVDIGIPIKLEASTEGAVWVDGGCSNANGIRISSSDVSIVGIGVRKTNEAGIRIDGGDDVTIDSVVIQDYNCDEGQDQFEAGVALWEGGARLRVTNSTIIRRVELGGNDRGFGNGIWVKNVGGNSGGGHYIAGNTIIGGYDGIGGEPEDVVYGGFYRDSIIERNTIGACWDDGIQVEGGNINVAVRENKITGCGVGVAFAPTLQGPLHIERNEIRDLVPGFYEQQSAFKMGDHSSGQVFITGNVIVTDGDGFKQSNDGSVGTIISRGNIVRVSRRVIEVGIIPSNSDFDEDCFWSTDPNRFIIWNGTDYQTLAEFQDGTGQEPNGVESPDCGQGQVTPPPSTPTFPPATPAHRLPSQQPLPRPLPRPRPRHPQLHPPAPREPLLQRPSHQLPAAQLPQPPRRCHRKRLRATSTVTVMWTPSMRCLS